MQVLLIKKWRRLKEEENFGIKNFKTYQKFSENVYKIRENVIKNINKLKQKLKSQNILSRNVYPPLNSQKIYKKYKGLPVSSNYCKNGLWLPSSLDIKMSQIDKISSIINKFYR